MAYVNKKTILEYLQKNESLSIGEAFINWQLSGGHITKIISNLRKDGVNIVSQWRKNTVTGRKYKRYSLITE
jgi:predicted ArsR family transcriptional regulator